jgi:hypothetical protein
MKCYTVYKRKNQVEKTCTYCNKKFAVSIKRSKEVSHCSRRCYIDEANNAGKRCCKDCGVLKSIEEFNAHNKTKEIRRRYCIECEKKRIKSRSMLPKQRWANARRRSARSGETWEIPLETYVKIISKRCHYCNGELNPTGCGLDRKDNEIGYLTENVVPCCKECNIIKNQFFTYKEMLLLSMTIKKIKKERSHSNRK